eukprot:CAMPEP_0194537216 /NCGR_PEP_ID=MMETSP0253-20130528/76416_1 /TAXON_ID=2966 /ORGANISM="Noctiluca scintillans" /LENGTH=42 /DNA_ID= /DNA_START= /DNA_END= /DNA_ORIENTATION=
MQKEEVGEWLRGEGSVDDVQEQTCPFQMAQEFVSEASTEVGI